MKRTVIILVSLAVLMPAIIYAQPTHANLVKIPTVADALPLTDAYFKEFVSPPTDITHMAEHVDFVTVGSLMPYRVDPVFTGNEIPKGTSFSIDYMWLFTPQAPLTHTFSVLQMPTAVPPNPGQATASSSAPTANWYTTNEISVRMPASTGAVVLSNSARFVFNGVVMCLDGTGPTPVDYKITVVNRPKLMPKTVSGTAVDVEIVSCVDEDAEFPVNTAGNALLDFTGIGPFNINFNIKRTPLSGTSTIAYNYTNLWLKLDDDKLIFPDALFDEPGVYEIDILNMNDKISRKSLDQDAVKAVAGTDVPTSSLKVFIYPSVNTPGVLSPVEHIRNVE